MLYAEPGISLSESRAKAAYVLNFIRLIDWPATSERPARAPLVVCSIGDDATNAFLPMIENRIVNDRLIKIRQESKLERINGCHVVYISRMEWKQAASVLRYLDGQPVLTISSIDGFIDRGGAIGLVQNENRLEFEVNREALKKASLVASSSLLKLARNLGAPK